MTTASRSLATAPLRARFASGLLPLSYTTTGDVSETCPPQRLWSEIVMGFRWRPDGYAQVFYGPAGV